MVSANSNEFAHQADSRINQDLLSLMSGDTNARGQNILALLTSGDFLETKPWLREELKAQFEKYFFATHVNSVWYVLPYAYCKQ
jgi:hypothetical protein